MALVYATLAMTLDGSIADCWGEWRPLCKYELERYRRALDWGDAVIVGARTVLDSGLDFNPRSRKERFIKALIDPRAIVPLEHAFFKKDSASDDMHILVFVSKFHAIVDKLSKKYENKNIEKLKILYHDGIRVEPRKIVSILEREYGAERIVVVGGGKLLSSFVESGLLNRMRITVTPQIMGGCHGLIPRIVSRYPGRIARLVKVELCPCGQEVVLHYECNFSRR